MLRADFAKYLISDIGCKAAGIQQFVIEHAKTQEDLADAIL